MAASSAQEPSDGHDDLAWLDQDPMTADEREAWLDHLAALDDPPEPEDEEDFDPLTAEELAEVYAAAADERLAIEAATTGRRGPGQAGSARVFPGESASPAAAFGPGWRWTCCRAAPGWRWPPTPRPGTKTTSPEHRTPN